MSEQDGGLTKAERGDAIVLAVNQMGHFLHSEGLSRREIAGAFGCGLVAATLQECELDHQDKELSGPLIKAIDRCIDETIADLKARTSTESPTP